jgi:hypothetical protein
VKNIITYNSTLNEMVNAYPLSSSNLHKRKINEKAIEIVATIFSWLFPSVRKRKCLFRSLLILFWSERFGLSPLLNVGLKFQGQVQGHAWLTVGNSPFCDSSQLCVYYPHEMATQGKIRFWSGT